MSPSPWHPRGSPWASYHILEPAEDSQLWGLWNGTTQPPCCGEHSDWGPLPDPALSLCWGHTSCGLLPANDWVGVLSEAHFWENQNSSDRQLCFKESPLAHPNQFWNCTAVWDIPHLPSSHGAQPCIADRRPPSSSFTDISPINPSHI